MTNTTDLFTRDGNKFDGKIQLSSKGKPGYFTQDRCHRCGGAGGSEAWRATGWTCYQCSGSGKGPVKFHPLYTAEKLVKLNTSQVKRDDKKEIKRQEMLAQREIARAVRRTAFLAIHEPLLSRCEAITGNNAVTDILSKARENYTLTDGQVAFLARMADEFEARKASAQISQHVGMIGQRFEVHVTVKSVANFQRNVFGSFSGAQETVWIVTMVDDAGNHIVTKTPNFRQDVGGSFVLRGTVKEHDEYKGVKQTIMTRATRKDMK